MMVRFTPSARKAYLEILFYLDQRNPLACERLMMRVERSLDRLQAFPNLGHFIPEYPDESYRQVIVDPYRFFYCIEGDMLWIVDVWHGRQLPDPPSLRTVP